MLLTNGLKKVAVVVRPSGIVHRSRNRLMGGRRPPTAVIAGNDWVTAPLLAAVRDADLSIPDEISFLSYADSRWAAAYRPPISVIRSDYEADGRTLASRVLRRLGEAVDDAVADRPLSREEFVDRASLAPPRK